MFSSKLGYRTTASWISPNCPKCSLSFSRSQVAGKPPWHDSTWRLGKKKAPWRWKGKEKGQAMLVPPRKSWPHCTCHGHHPQAVCNNSNNIALCPKACLHSSLDSLDVTLRFAHAFHHHRHHHVLFRAWPLIKNRRNLCLWEVVQSGLPNFYFKAPSKELHLMCRCCAQIHELSFLSKASEARALLQFTVRPSISWEAPGNNAFRISTKQPTSHQPVWWPWLLHPSNS